MNVYVLIQARLGSTRLPRKVLMDIGGKTMLERVVERAEQIGPPVGLVIPEQDSELHTYAIEREWPCYLGSEEDVLSRYAETARALRDAIGVEHIVRVTADCPYLDVEAARVTIAEHLHGGYDMTTYHEAEGRGVQVYKTEALLFADQHAFSVERHSPDVAFLPGEPGHGAHGFAIHHVRFSVDTQEDLETARRRWAREVAHG